MNARTHRLRSGYTLLELLAGMAILVVIVLMLTRIFAETMSAWDQGTRRVSQAQEARVVMDFLTQGISSALGDDKVSFRVFAPGGFGPSENPHGYPSSAVAFIAPTRTPPYSSTMRRATPHYVYFVDQMLDDSNAPMDGRYRLVRVRRTETTHDTAGNRSTSAFRDPQWWSPGNWGTGIQPAEREVVAENVAGFAVRAYTASGGYVADYDSMDQGSLPLWVDISLGMMDEATALRVAETGDQELIQRSVRWYGTRVFFRNREGVTCTFCL
jgi:prepilin-type N-terminal cleavage/methylation domain-containing protein